MLIKDGETGFIKDADDLDGWVKVISYICDHESQLKKMKSKTQKLIREKFLWSNIAPRFEALYRKVLKNG